VSTLDCKETEETDAELADWEIEEGVARHLQLYQAALPACCAALPSRRESSVMQTILLRCRQCRCWSNSLSLYLAYCQPADVMAPLASIRSLTDLDHKHCRWNFCIFAPLDSARCCAKPAW
jgi:hypothetical protein